MTWTRQNSGAAWTAADDADAATVFEPNRQNEECAVFGQSFAGGSHTKAIDGTGYQDLDDPVDLEIPDTISDGGVWKLLVDRWVEDAGNTVTVKVRCTSTPADAVVGGASSSLTPEREELAFTPLAGETYRAMAVKGDDATLAWAHAKWQRTAA